MPRWDRSSLPRIATQREMESLLKREGWKRTQGGKHGVKMEKEGRRPIVLPDYKRQTYDVGLTQRILQQAGLVERSTPDA